MYMNTIHGSAPKAFANIISAISNGIISAVASFMFKRAMNTVCLYSMHGASFNRRPHSAEKPVLETLTTSEPRTALHEYEAERYRPTHCPQTRIPTNFAFDTIHCVRCQSAHVSGRLGQRISKQAQTRMTIDLVDRITRSCNHCTAAAEVEPSDSIRRR